MEYCIKAISERLASKGYQVEIFTSNIAHKKTSNKSIRNLSVHYLKAFEFAHTPVIPSLFFKLLMLPKNFIIHVHISQPFVPEIVWIISKIRNIPYTAHIHSDIGPSGILGFLLPLYKKVFLKPVLLSASKIIVPTTDYVNLISNKYNISLNKICVVPYGIDHTNFYKSSINMHKPARLLFVGRLQIQKNLPLLVKSFYYLINHTKLDVELNIVGDGEDRDKICKLINTLGLTDRIHLQGKLQGKNLYKMYSCSDIFVLTSSYESFGIVLIEAMASGLQIVVSNIPSVRNVVINEKTGLLSESSEKDFAMNITRILTNSSFRKKLIANGLKEVKKYNWDNIVLKYQNLYTEVKNENN
jgi:rhamnosyl/mannosyltransferase